MRGVKGRFLKKLKTLPVSLKQNRVLQLKDHSVNSILHATKSLLVVRNDEEKKGETGARCRVTSWRIEEDADAIDISDLMKELGEDEEEEETLTELDEKENITPPAKKKCVSPSKVIDDTNSAMCSPPSTEVIFVDRKHSIVSLSDSNVTAAIRRVRPGSLSLFDPDLLAAFEKAVMDHILSHEAEKTAERQAAIESSDEEIGQANPVICLNEFEERCPPDGNESVVLYTTTIRAIRKTFEECNSVRHVLCTLRVLFDERDVSMHMKFREELKVLLSTSGGTAVSFVPPSLFIKGRFIGGAQEVLGLHEQGKLVGLLQGVRRNRAAATTACDGCGGVRFVLCFHCRGSCRIVVSGCDLMDGKTRCPHCNENGLIRCPVCI